MMTSTRSANYNSEMMFSPVNLIHVPKYCVVSCQFKMFDREATATVEFVVTLE